MQQDVISTSPSRIARCSCCASYANSLVNNWVPALGSRLRGATTVLRRTMSRL